MNAETMAKSILVSAPSPSCVMKIILKTTHHRSLVWSVLDKKKPLLQDMTVAIGAYPGGIAIKMYCGVTSLLGFVESQINIQYHLF